MTAKPFTRIPTPVEPSRPLTPPAHLRPVVAVPEWESAFQAARGMCACAGECQTHYGRCYAPGTGPGAHRLYLTTSLTGSPIIACDTCMSGRERIERRAERTAAKQRKSDEPTLF